MNRHLHALFLVCVLIGGCKNYSHEHSTQYGPLHQIDSIIEAGGNPYDVASYLHEHVETLDLDLDFSQGEGYRVMTSPDGNLRVYSVYDWPDLSYMQVNNIILYRDGEYYEDIHIKADAGDWGYISNIGMVKNSGKIFYILVSDYQSPIHGTTCTTMVSVYSVDERIFDSLKREQTFVTKSGRLIDSIELQWHNSFEYSLPNNYFGISIDNPKDTHEIFVQVIDAKTVKPLDKAIVYRWDGRHFTYSEIRPMKIERIIE